MIDVENSFKSLDNQIMSYFDYLGWKNKTRDNFFRKNFSKLQSKIEWTPSIMIQNMMN